MNPSHQYSAIMRRECGSMHDTRGPQWRQVDMYCARRVLTHLLAAGSRTSPSQGPEPRREACQSRWRPWV